MVEVEFHCKGDYYFKDGCMVRAFCYKEYEIRMHNHEFFEINIVLGGTGIHCIERGRVSVKRGDVFVIPPMVAHAYVDTQHLEVYHIVIHKSFFLQNREVSREVPGFLQLMEIEPVLRSNLANVNFLHLSSSEMQRFEQEMDFIDDAGSYYQEHHYLMRHHAAWKIIYWFSGLLYNRTLSAKYHVKHKYEKQIIQILEFLHTHYHEKITVDSLCAMVYLSRSTFLRSFREICGATPVDYLNRFRCKKALELLEITSLSKTEIAHLCGFYDLSHMERMLKSNNSGNRAYALSQWSQL